MVGSLAALVYSVAHHLHRRRPASSGRSALQKPDDFAVPVVTSNHLQLPDYLVATMVLFAPFRTPCGANRQVEYPTFEPHAENLPPSARRSFIGVTPGERTWPSSCSEAMQHSCSAL